jgi:sigma-B regulation protein RsbU (phosphoserine phosphatase)
LPRQTALLPGIDVDARYTPAQKVGGDLYDVFSLPGGRLGIAVADVSGKGIPASLLMAIARTNLRQIAPRHESPARVLAELNRAIIPDIDGTLYVTVVYAVIDAANNRLSFARAGHELPLFCRRDPASGAFLAQFVGSEGMPVGMVPDQLFTSVIAERTEPFHPGDILVLYTDGVTESVNEDKKEFSGARLADAVRSLHGLGARHINDGIIESVERFVGEGPQQDDLTLVTVKRL